MAFALAGVPNAVATCGTALADDHFLIAQEPRARRWCSPTTPTPRARARPRSGTSWEQRYEVQFQVADLPRGQRPRRRVARRSRGARDARSRAPRRSSQFRIDRVLAAADLATLEGRARAAEAGAAIDRRAPERPRARPVRHEARRASSTSTPTVCATRWRASATAQRRDQRRPTAATRTRLGEPRPPRPVARRSARARRAALGGARAGAGASTGSTQRSSSTRSPASAFDAHRVERRIARRARDGRRTRCATLLQRARGRGTDRRRTSPRRCARDLMANIVGAGCAARARRACYGPATTARTSLKLLLDALRARAVNRATGKPFSRTRRSY